MPIRPHSLSPRALPAILLAAALVGACGGGSTPTAPAGGGADVELATFKLLNTSRMESAGAAPLRFNDLLAEVARGHSRAMRDRGFFSHTDPSGDGLRERLRRAGVQFSAAAENLVQISNRTDPATTAHLELMASPGHRANILDRRFTEVGVGIAQQGDSYWVTQVFVSP